MSVDRNRELGRLAFLFRGTRDLEERNQIAVDYAKEVERLIETGLWDYAPNFDEMLPDEYMPKSFDKHWNETEF